MALQIGGQTIGVLTNARFAAMGGGGGGLGPVKNYVD